MKIRLIALMSLLVFSQSSYASQDHSLLQLPKGMKLASMETARLASASTANAELECKLFGAKVVDNQSQDSELLLDQKTQPFTIGTLVLWRVQFPAPYQDTAVVFNHMLSGYAETGNAMSPYVQAFFMKNGQPTGDVKDASFDINSAQVGSKVLLRGSFNDGDTSVLTYQCSLNYL